MSSRSTYPVFRLHPVPQTEEERSIAEVDAVLPQTQCTKCGYDGCRPYATAIVKGEADINQCPPGGEHGIQVLADLLQRPYKPLDTTRGLEQPRMVAVIDEPVCIGCTLCIQACPVDAIVGAAKQMHTIVAELCTGCDLCVAPCPVDCISMQPISAEEAGRDRTQQWREQREFHLFRMERIKWEKENGPKPAGETASASTEGVAEASAAPAAGLMPLDAKRALIAAAMERARQQREAAKPQNIDNLSDATRAQIEAIEARRKQNEQN